MKKNISRVSTSTLSIALIFPLFFTACSSESKEEASKEAMNQTEESTTESETKEAANSSIVDTKYSDGTPIRYVVIGKQIWGADNLRVTKFRDGTPILGAQSKADWIKAGKGRSAAYCFAGDDPASQRNSFTTSDNLQTLDVSGLSNGTYFYSLCTASKVYQTGKFVVAH